MRRKRHYKEIVRGTMISLRLTQAEHLRLKMGALRERTSVSGLMRRGVEGLIAGAPMAGTMTPTAAAATTAAVASPVTPDVEATPAATPVVPQSV